MGPLDQKRHGLLTASRTLDDVQVGLVTAMNKWRLADGHKQNRAARTVPEGPQQRRCRPVGFGTSDTLWSSLASPETQSRERKPASMSFSTSKRTFLASWILVRFVPSIGFRRGRRTGSVLPPTADCQQRSVSVVLADVLPCMWDSRRRMCQ